jgi:hypothetical protein
MSEYGIPARTPGRYEEHDRLILSNEQNEVICGALLGDGHLTKPRSCNSRFEYSSSIKGHTEYVTSFFVELLTSGTSGVKHISVFDNRTNKTYQRYYMNTFNNVTFTGLRSVWYDEFGKIIPLDIKLTPLTCLLWYIGDGGLAVSKRSAEIRIATNCFHIGYIEGILIPQLSEFHAKVRKTNKEGQYLIVISRFYSRYFLDFWVHVQLKSWNTSGLSLNIREKSTKEG